jgi:hypothetical protein
MVASEGILEDNQQYDNLLDNDIFAGVEQRNLHRTVI